MTGLLPKAVCKMQMKGQPKGTNVKSVSTTRYITRNGRNEWFMESGDGIEIRLDDIGIRLCKYPVV